MPSTGRSTLARSRCAVLVAMVMAHAGGAAAQTPDPLRITEPTVTVTAQKEPQNIQQVPASVTAVTKKTLTSDNITTLSGAGIFAPNTFFSEFTARKLSFPRFRGIGSGPGNPAITTYVDGVPMMHTNASNVELVDVEQVEFVRGGQSALFGRNALGGIINVASSRPSLSNWTGRFTVPFGNYGTVDARGTISGPVSDSAAISLSAGRSVRDGFTTNDLNNLDVDYRGSTFGKAQLLWAPASNWETRLIVGGERSRDGDYALTDLESVRSNPYHTQVDFKGHTDRDTVSGAFLARREGSRMTFSSTTGVVDWRTNDQTDLDYTPFPFLIRSNAEAALQFTQEVRLASAAAAPIRWDNGTTLRWQAGAMFFTQGYEQDAVNSYSPYVLALQIPFPVDQHTPTAVLDDLGLGVYGQGTFTLRDRLDLTLGARADYESKEATLDTYFSPTIAAPTHVEGDRSFSNVSPQAAVAYRLQPDRMLYASLGTGYKAGGFNPASPAGAEAFGEEHSWQIEGGVKTAWANGRVMTNASVFYIDWSDMQVNVPNPQVPAQFYVANAGSARSTGVELEVSGRAAEGFDLFAIVGYTNARFQDGAVSSGVDVSGNALASTPEYTTTLGARYRRTVAGDAGAYASGEVVLTGAYDYDDANTVGQEAYSLTNLRAGVEKGRFFGEAWIRNAFNTLYIPVAFAYPGLAPSGFVAEPGRPRTFGARVGVTF